MYCVHKQTIIICTNLPLSAVYCLLSFDRDNVNNLDIDNLSFSSPHSVVVHYIDICWKTYFVLKIGFSLVFIAISYWLSWNLGNWLARNPWKMGILEKISEIEKEIARTQKNKGKFCISMKAQSRRITAIRLYIWSSRNLKFRLFSAATEYHLGLLKAKLAKYRSELLEPSKKGEKGEGFDVLKSGDARVALIGFPSVGKVSNRKINSFWNFIKCINKLFIVVYATININQNRKWSGQLWIHNVSQDDIKNYSKLLDETSNIFDF